MIKMQIIGHLAQDAGTGENNGKKYVKFVVGVDEGKGEQKKTRWITCITYNEKVLPYLTKGKQVYVDGEHRVRLNVTQEGKNYINEFISVSELQLLGKKEQQQQVEDLPMGF